MTYNEKASCSIYNAVRKDTGLSRSEIAEKTGLARSTVSLQVAELLNKGLLEEEQKAAAQRKLKLSINPNKGYFIGALLGIRRFSVQIVNLNYQVVTKMQCHLQNIYEPQDCNAFLLETLQNLIAELPELQGKILGLGLGLPFPIDFAAGKPDSPPYLPLWHDFPLTEYYGKGLGIPVLVDNDVNVMAWGEVVQQPKLDNTLFVKIGTGIGCGIVLQHKIYRGAQGAAGDIGHIAVPDSQYIDSSLCHCGHLGCLETVAGRKALLKESQKAALAGESSFLQSLLPELETQHRELNLQDLSRAAQTNDPFTIRLFQEKGKAIGSVLSSLVNAFNPDSIVLGGSLCRAGGLHLLQAIRQQVLQRSPHLATSKLNIALASDFVWGGSLGAAALIGEHIFAEEFHQHLFIN